MKQIPLAEKPRNISIHINSPPPKKTRPWKFFPNGWIEVEKNRLKKNGPDLLGWKNPDVSMEVSTATSL